jgi:Rod binding domain-containing protein
MTSPAWLNSAALPPAPPKPHTPEAAAKQFEALLIGEMLRSAREAAADGEEGEDGNTSQTMLDVADQQFAQVLANNGGLGMAKMIVQGLEKKANPR